MARSSTSLPSGSRVYVHDRQNGTTVLASVSAGEDPVPGNGNSCRPFISSDGSSVVFVSRADNLVANDTNMVTDVFVRDLTRGVTERVNVSSNGAEAIPPASGGGEAFPGETEMSAISADGRFVVFESNATNLVPEVTTDWNIFLPERTVSP